MKRLVVAILVMPLLLVGLLQTASAHCEVPCGIYADQHRFESMLEDTATIAKAIDQIQELLTGMKEGPTPKAVNQVTRWVNTKESHATNTQHIIAQYFMTQRIKPGEGYTEKLTAAHAVMQAAMKCKQDADPATAVALKEAIIAFHKVYEPKN